jgi:hypothetical protein
VEVVGLCKRCAVVDLPKLLADALVGSAAGRPKAAGRLVVADLETFERRFWKAAYLAAEHGRDRRLSAGPPLRVVS